MYWWSDRRFSFARRNRHRPVPQVRRDWRPFTRLLWRLPIAVLLLTLLPARASAQGSAGNAYWQYSAPGRLNEVLIVDVDNDGVDEILAVAEQLNIVLVRSNGRAVWRTPFQVESPVTSIAVGMLSNEPQSEQAIIIATEQELLAIDINQTVLWSRPLQVPAVQLVAVDVDGDALAEIILTRAASSSQLQMLNANGTVRWSYSGSEAPADDAFPHLLINDFSQSGRIDIIFGYFAERGFSELALIDSDGRARWERPVEGVITAAASTDFADSQSIYLAVGTNRGSLYLFDVVRNRRVLYRTPSVNKPITSLATATMPGGRFLFLGTAAGRLIAYDAAGRRVFDERLGEQPDRAVISISPNPTQRAAQPFSMALTLASTGQNAAEPAEVLLLDESGTPLPESFPAASTLGLTQLLDINHDNLPELLLAGFGTLQLLDPGIGAGENVNDWEYFLDGRPQTVTVLDDDGDGVDELLIGVDQGGLYLLNTDGTESWIEDVGGSIAGTGFLRVGLSRQPAIVVAHNNLVTDVGGTATYEGRLDLLQVDGSPVLSWGESKIVPSSVTQLLLHDVRGDGEPSIVVGTDGGDLVAYSSSGQLLWQTRISGAVTQIAGLSVNGAGSPALLVSSAAQSYYLIDTRGNAMFSEAVDRNIVGVHVLPRAEARESRLVVVTADGVVRGLSEQGTSVWTYAITAAPRFTQLAGSDSLLIATENDTLIRLTLERDNGPARLWELSNLGTITTLHWGDLNGDSIDDVAIGNQDGAVLLYPGDGTRQLDRLELDSRVQAITVMRRGRNQPGELAVITNNGVVQHFQAQANRPPLIVQPEVLVGTGRYSISVTLINVEPADQVRVALELFDDATGEWVADDVKVAAGNSALVWQLDPNSLNIEGVSYRFAFNDGVHQGWLDPLQGPPPILETPALNPWPAIGLALGLLGLTGGYLYWQTHRTLNARVRRFYRRLAQQPRSTLQLLDVAYRMTGGSPDYLLSLANHARRDGNQPLANLGDGLFLLADRPEAALPIINSGLKSAAASAIPWHNLQRWQAFFDVATDLYHAPTITEISLLRPRFEQMLQERGRAEKPSVSIDALQPVMTSLRDSERVDMVDDRLVYLNEAAVLLRQLQERLFRESTAIEATLLNALAARWAGLIKAEIEGLRGQARLVTTLRTRRIVPAAAAEIALEIENTGRAPAENIAVYLQADPAYEIIRQPAAIPYLPAGRKRQVTCTVKPTVTDRFRIAYQIVYNDRNGDGKRISFGDMVNLLPPAREFTPVRNLYAPGMPLRRDSQIFFGREDVFAFIRESVGQESRQNVIILVGQRRTGKTSMLLRLSQHLPDNLIPVYVDCQSLGVVEGIGAFFYDIAWLVADTFAERDIELSVPELEVWQSNPANHFQRHFIPDALAKLPPDNQIVLVFDEFEAFEDLVANNILPPTLFTYLRHLMQHSKGLSFVFVGTHRLEQMTSDYWSVLFNIALYRRIDLLPKLAALKLVTEPVAPHIVYDDLALDKIWRVTAGHPYFLQLVCYALVNKANKNRSSYITISDVNAALDDMLRLGEVHFAYIWKLSSQTQRMLLTAVAHHVEPDTPFHPVDLVNYLSQYGIVLDPAEVTAALSGFVDRDIMRQITSEGTALFELKIGLIGLWTARNKSLTQLYETATTRNGKSSNGVKRSGTGSPSVETGAAP